jgi:hypothetical protein
VSLSTLRVSSSTYCELSCAYCRLTHSKKNITGEPQTALPLAKNIILPCNSFYEEDLEKKISEAQAFFQKIFLELHFVTATMERHQTRLTQLANTKCSWIIHIDHLDHKLINQLAKWDAQVCEYRLFPSKIYPVEMFLRDLPPFIQKKLKWIFSPQEDISDDFTDIETTAEVVENLRRTSLHTFALASPHWPHTVGHEAPIHKQGTYWSAIDASAYQNSDWPVHLSKKTSAYLGYLHCPANLDLDSILAKHKVSVIYLETSGHRDLLMNFKSHFSQAPSLFLLENFLVRREIWQVYLRTYTNYNHWTWSHFIKNENIQTVTIPALKADRISTIDIEDLRSSCREHYLQTLDFEFYKKHFNFFHKINGFRKAIALVFSFLFSLKHRVPSSVRHKVHERSNSLYRKWNDVMYSFALFGESLKKLGLFVFHRGYWFLHRQFWRLNTMFWFLNTIFWHLNTIFWRLNTIFWQCYQVFAPAFGFVSSLFEFPEHYKHHSFPQRCRLKTLFIARKLAWLALKIAGKR